MQSECVRLRPVQKADAALLYEWITDRELVIHNAPYFPVSESDHEAWIERMMTKRSDLVIFVIEEIASGKAIGTCQLLNINWIHRSAELQIRIGDTACRGKGYGTEAVSMLCEFSFADLNMHRTYLHVFANNRHAIRAYEKNGFVSEGALREAAFIDGKWSDVIVMGRLRTYA
jgi:diamine N-acetyltransferase